MLLGQRLLPWEAAVKSACEQPEHYLDQKSRVRIQLRLEDWLLYEHLAFSLKSNQSGEALGEASGTSSKETRLEGQHW